MKKFKIFNWIEPFVILRYKCTYMHHNFNATFTKNLIMIHLNLASQHLRNSIEKLSFPFITKWHKQFINTQFIRTLRLFIFLYDIILIGTSPKHESFESYLKYQHSLKRSKNL